MFTILRQAFRRTAQNWQIVLLIFLTNAGLGLILAFPAFSTLQNASHNSLIFNDLVRDFDFTAFNDFLNNGAKSLKPLLPMSLVLSGIYVLLNIFFSGGILSQFTVRDTFRISDFLKNSIRYFLPFLAIFLLQLIFIIFAFATSIVLFVLFGVKSDGLTEPKFLLWMLIPSSFTFYYFTYLLNVGDYARVLLHRDNLLNPWKAFWRASKYVFANFKTMKVYWAVLVIIFAFILCYLFLESSIGMKSGFTIWLMFLIQQLFIFGRVFARIWNLSNAYDYVSLRPIPLTEKPVIIEPTIEAEKENIEAEKENDQEEKSENKLSE